MTFASKASKSDLVLVAILLYFYEAYKSFLKSNSLTDGSPCFFINTTYAFTMFYILTKALKKWLHNTYRSPVFERPREAKNCGYFGFAKNEMAGFPSEHMFVVTFLSVVLFWVTKQQYKLPLGMLFVTLIGLVSWGRLSSNCHSPIQVAAGILWGGFAASLWLKFTTLKCNL
jgi:membrane-associated phospholipid phosphatase